MDDTVRPTESDAAGSYPNTSNCAANRSAEQIRTATKGPKWCPQSIYFVRNVESDRVVMTYGSNMVGSDRVESDRSIESRFGYNRIGSTVQRSRFLKILGKTELQIYNVRSSLTSERAKLQLSKRKTNSICCCNLR